MDMMELQPLVEQLPSLRFVLDLVYYVSLGFFAVFTAILYYHWTNYATERSVSRITLIAYMLCTLPLLLIMGVIILVI
jgi:hypothetical protein